ncbi:preprotein translocase SecA [Nakamurella endophytica]|uniref:Preprotein translocase SecA n=1 Tax=Nakamurella endophytica TaxID=1748367 RepID=A0A917T557_9ACTN|nr:preprotein translocase SecA [Nakamurella endophytica]
MLENPRRPCPCGSGRRYKACHGSADAAEMIVARPFAGLEAETELIALREFVPSATAPLTLRDAAPDAPTVTLATVLPGAAAALTRADGSVLLGLQVQTHSGDLSRDLAAALEWALAAEPSSVLTAVGRPSTGNRWGDVVVDEPLDVTVHDDFGWWLEEAPEEGSEVALSLERANTAIMPTARVAGRPGAYWVDAGEKAHLRWVRAEDEQPLMSALARLAAADRLDLGEGSRYVGSFRAHGRLVPVWDLDREAHPSEWDGPAVAFDERLQEALAVDEPLTADQRRARDGILGRQFTLR